MVTALTNLYCLLASVVEEKLHKLDFFLPILQCALDFCFSGVLSLTFNIAVMKLYFQLGCAEYNMVLYTEAYFDRNYHYDFWQTRQWQRFCCFFCFSMFAAVEASLTPLKDSCMNIPKSTKFFAKMGYEGHVTFLIFVVSSAAEGKLFSRTASINNLSLF